MAQITRMNYVEQTGINILETFLARRGEELAKTPKIVREQPYPYFIQKTARAQDVTNTLLDDQLAENQIVLIYDYKISTNATAPRFTVEANDEKILQGTNELFHEFVTPILVEPGKHIKITESHTTAPANFTLKIHATTYTVRWD